ncbi:MAG: hypothetical protein GC150_09060 [Rhizobiales bacterium]|nr:hypothetical protein [Hyphomicrobiales bacterium]
MSKSGESSDRRCPVVATDVMLAGDILRVVHGGLPKLAGESAGEQLEDLRLRFEPFRRFLNTPPHGNWLVNSCLLYPAATEPYAGRFFLASSFGYAPLAGTALMAGATVAVDEGRIPPVEGWTAISMDTALGSAQIEVEISRNEVVRARWRTQIPRVLVADGNIAQGRWSGRNFSVVMTGLPYIVITDEELGISIHDHERLGPTAAELSRDVSKAYPLSDFGIENSYAQWLVMVTHSVSNDETNAVWISDQGFLARSAGGTGALAVHAIANMRGRDDPSAPLRVRAPGGAFLCRITNDHASVMADVRICARHEFFPDSTDIMAS